LKNRNVFGHYSIKTKKDREREFSQTKQKESLRYDDLKDDQDVNPVHHPPREENHFSQSLSHPTNEMYDTKLIHKPKGNRGVSIMSGEINKVHKNVRKVYDREKVPYAGSSIDITQPDVFRYEVDKELTRNNPMLQSYKTFRKAEDKLDTFSPTRTEKPSTFYKSRNSTHLKKVNSMERILEWQPKGLHKLNLINDKKNIFMEKSLKNIIPYQENSIGHKPYAVDYPTKAQQYQSKLQLINSPHKEFKLPNLSLSKLSY